MKESNMNNCSNSFNPESKIPAILKVTEWIVISTGLPLTLVAIFAVYSLLCCMAVFLTTQSDAARFIYFFGLISSIGSMVCVSLERYLAITQPLWYRFRRNIKTSVVVCVVVWAIPWIYALPLYFKANFPVIVTICGVFLLLPLPLFIFFLVGTIKALSAARSVPADEKRRIVAILVVLLFIYMLLFLPSIIWFLAGKHRCNQSFYNVAFTLLIFSPLADLVMYILIRKSVMDKFLASLCCCKMSNNPQTSSMSNDSMSASCNQVV
ncbi:G-protein coupled receptor 4-like isoform X2 [Melanotaenia boesemani]|uniref:G-protein coupled receptor 4-like isoform X2 n=1 Tax=Melanotaenia boesemani TaxID=1250792 RepID=UPI001C05C6A6|nr:G-protein coupled receptor 4-like isoform X2 [Melanotaenia boesemani]